MVTITPVLQMRNEGPMTQGLTGGGRQSRVATRSGGRARSGPMTAPVTTAQSRPLMPIQIAFYTRTGLDMETNFLANTSPK